LPALSNCQCPSKFALTDGPGGGAEAGGGGGGGTHDGHGGGGGGGGGAAARIAARSSKTGTAKAKPVIEKRAAAKSADVRNFDMY